MALTPLPRATAWRGVARCFARSVLMLARREVHLPRECVGKLVRFADGTTGRVYCETRTDRDPAEPCFLAVSFRLRGVRGRAHALFRAESILNTPLFVGFPGFVSKLWLAHDQRGAYRGVYEWDGEPAARAYAQRMVRVLELVSVPGSIDYRVLPGVRRDDLLGEASPAAGRPVREAAPEAARETAQESAEEAAWWRVVEAA